MRDMINIQPPCPMKESRRVLIEILRRQVIDIQSIIQIIQNKRVPDDWKVIGLHSKEREIKIAARMFSMMVRNETLLLCN